VDGGRVAYHPASDTVHFVNPAGAVILELCDGAHTEGEIADLVQALYGLPAPPVDEVRSLLARARADGLIQPLPSPAALLEDPHVPR
jgi:PqqD family protein of HPr-rel-A system